MHSWTKHRHERMGCDRHDEGTLVLCDGRRRHHDVHKQLLAGDPYCRAHMGLHPERLFQQTWFSSATGSRRLCDKRTRETMACFRRFQLAGGGGWCPSGRKKV